MEARYDIRREADRSLVVAGIPGTSPAAALDEYVGWFKPSEGMQRLSPTIAFTRDGQRIIVTPRNKPSVTL